LAIEFDRRFHSKRSRERGFTARLPMATSRNSQRGERHSVGIVNPISNDDQNVGGTLRSMGRAGNTQGSALSESRAGGIGSASCELNPDDLLSRQHRKMLRMTCGWGLPASASSSPCLLAWSHSQRPSTGTVWPRSNHTSFDPLEVSSAHGRRRRHFLRLPTSRSARWRARAAVFSWRLGCGPRCSRRGRVGFA
jgi:hypothetical protein